MPEPAVIAERFRRFAAMEAHGVSPLYEQLALGVARDLDLIAVLCGLPTGKQQPNLLFAAARFIAGMPSGFADFRRLVLEHRDALIATMLSRRTQTNEPARCAAFYPLLASLPQPLALLEVGASAGLCLLPDRYRYDYDGLPAGDADSPLVLHCHIDGDCRHVPGTVSVVWRAGVDLNPLDVTNPDDVRWLETLVWPEQHDRRERLHAAVAIASNDPPRIIQGDLTERLGDTAAQAPTDATLVVFHTATLNYLRAEDRAAFVDQVSQLRGHWISQEGPSVLPSVDVGLPQQPPGHTAVLALAIDGRPVAFTAPHGGWLRCLADPRGDRLRSAARSPYAVATTRTSRHPEWRHKPSRDCGTARGP